MYGARADLLEWLKTSAKLAKPQSRHRKGTMSW
jgi:hypothetical protein